MYTIMIVKDILYCFGRLHVYHKQHQNFLETVHLPVLNSLNMNILILTLGHSYLVMHLKLEIES